MQKPYKSRIGPVQYLRVQLRRLLNALPGSILPVIDWLGLADALACLPLTTEQYAVCLSQLRNAARNLAEGESGAARYELRLLAGRVGALL